MWPAGSDEAPGINPPPAPEVQGAEPAKARFLPPEGQAPRGGTRLPPTALSATPNVLGLLTALRRRWFLAVSLGLLLALPTAGVMWYLKPINFTARTLLHVDPEQQSVLFPQGHGRGDFGNYQRNQVFLAKSRLVLNSALRDPKVAALPSVQKQIDPVEWLERIVQADFSLAPETLRISITGESPEELKALVKAVRDAYLTEIVNKEASVRLKRLEQLKKLNAEYEDILREKRKTLREMATALGSPDKGVLAKKQEFNQKFLYQLESELLKRRSELLTAQETLFQLQLKERAADRVPLPDLPVANPWLMVAEVMLPAKLAVPPGIPVSEKAVEELVSKNPAIQSYQKEIANLGGDVAKWRERSPDPEHNAGYQGAVAALAAKQKALEALRAKLRPALMEEVRTRAREALASSRYQAQEMATFLERIVTKLGSELEQGNSKFQELKKATVDLAWLQDEITQVEQVSKTAAQQKQVLEVEMLAPSRFTLLEEESSVPATTESSRIRLAGGAGLGVFGACIFGIAFLEFRVRRVSRVEEVTQGLRMKLVGALPTVPKGALGGGGGNRNAYWQNRLTESVDAIRTTLMNAARFEGVRTVMVTSAVGGEGKTLLSSHLAASLARAGFKTLLIDGDLRRPAVHRLFDLSLPSGLSELLRGEAVAADVTRAGPVDALSIITAGQSDGQAVQALAHQRLGDVLNQVRDAYDFVIVDSAPVLPVADSQMIGQHVDAVVFSVMRDVSRLPEVYAAYERLAVLRIRVLGAVVNGAAGGAYGSSYHYAAPPEAAAPAAAAAAES